MRIWADPCCPSHQSHQVPRLSGSTPSSEKCCCFLVCTFYGRKAGWDTQNGHLSVKMPLLPQPMLTATSTHCLSRAGCPSGHLPEGFWGCQSLLCTTALPSRAPAAPAWGWVRGLILPLASHGGLVPCGAHPHGEISPSCRRLIVAQIICDHCWKVWFMREERTASPPQCRHFYSQLKPQETWTGIQAVGGGKRNSFQELIQKKKSLQCLFFQNQKKD